MLFETADSGELNYRAELRDAMLRAIGTSRFAVYHHIIRRRVDADLAGEFSDAFSRKLDARWRQRCERRQLYVNELFLTLVRRPMQGRSGIADRLARVLRSPSPSANAATLRGDMASLNNAREALMAALAQYDPVLLTRYEGEGGGTRSEPMEFLSCLFNGDMRPVAEPHGDIGMHLPARRISFGAGRYGTPVWSPRGDLIAFTKQNEGRFHIGVMRTDGSEERLLTSSFLDESPTWAPNGRVLMFFRDQKGGGGPQLFSIDLSGRNEQRVPTQGFASDPAWSPLQTSVQPSWSISPSHPQHRHHPCHYRWGSYCCNIPLDWCIFPQPI